MATRRNLWLAGALLGLIVVVAVAARAHSPAGGGGTHAIDSKLVWEFVLIGFVALFLLSLPVAVWVIVTTRLDAPPSKRRKRNRNYGVLLALAIFMVAITFGAERFYGNRNHAKKSPLQNSALLHPGTRKPNDLGKPVPFDWLPAVVILSIAGVGAGVIGYVLFRRPSKRVPTEAELAARLTAVLDDSLDDLRAERDPRRAVIGTYARMEQTLAGAGLPRFVAETPLEYLGRVLRELLHTSADAVARLTTLFERAKFSPHEIDGSMKIEAIHALVAVRDELREAAA